MKPIEKRAVAVKTATDKKQNEVLQWVENLEITFPTNVSDLITLEKLAIEHKNKCYDSRFSPGCKKEIHETMVNYLRQCTDYELQLNEHYGSDEAAYAAAYEKLITKINAAADEFIRRLMRQAAESES